MSVVLLNEIVNNIKKLSSGSSIVTESVNNLYQSNDEVNNSIFNYGGKY